jgi:hypothetical protein
LISILFRDRWRDRAGVCLFLPAVLISAPVVPPTIWQPLDLTPGRLFLDRPCSELSPFAIGLVNWRHASHYIHYIRYALPRFFPAFVFGQGSIGLSSDGFAKAARVATVLFAPSSTSWAICPSTSVVPIRCSRLSPPVMNSGSIVITTNRTFQEWRNLFDVDNTLAMALIDRLMHYGEGIVIEGDSYRVRDEDPDSTDE